MSNIALVTGATGLLGRQVFNVFQHSGCLVVGQGFSRATPPTILKADLEKSEDIQRLLNEVKPQIIIHCAANRYPDLCEQNPEQARKVNVDSSRTLAQGASDRGAFLIYISTDYVFPGTEGEAPYEADTKTSPPNTYGMLKREGELAVLDATKDSHMAVILRLPVLYGSATKHSESAVNSLVDVVWKAQDEKAGIKMDDWAQRYPTNTEDVARVCRDIVIKYVKEMGRIKEMPRILQFTSEDRMTKYQMCEKLAEVLGLSLAGMVRDQRGNDPNSPVKRPYDVHLSTKVLQDLGINVKTMDFVSWWKRELGAYRK